MLFLLSGGLSATVLYSVADLGKGFKATGINDSGQVAGYALSSTGFPSGALLYSNGQFTSLGSSGSYFEPSSINDAGQVAGSSFSAAPSHALLYSGGMLTDLGTLGGSGSFAYSINNQGQVTGGSLLTGAGPDHAFLYSNGQMTDLGTLPGYTSSRGNSVNNQGEVAGTAYTSLVNQPPRSFIYTNGHLVDLGALGGGTYSDAHSINDYGQVTGVSGLNYPHAFLYSNGQMMDLGTLGGLNVFSVGNSINNNGQVVGRLYQPDYIEGGYTDISGFLYANGAMQNLNDLIDPKLGITITNAFAINDAGQILATTKYGGGSLLLTPVPEPDTIMCLGAGLLTLLLLRWVWCRRAIKAAKYLARV